MKNLLASLLILCIIFTVKSQSREFDVNDFNDLSFAIAGDLYLTQGSECKVVIEASEETLEEIEVDQFGKNVTIGFRRSRGWGNWSEGTVKVYVTMRTIESLSVSGSGNIQAEGTLDVDDLGLYISGSGDMDLSVEGDELEFRISGSGKIEVSGNADIANAHISGSGRVLGEDLVVDVFEAKISGSGDCYITANETIEAEVSGSGKVYYRGEPSTVNSESSGSGGVRRL